MLLESAFYYLFYLKFSFKLVTFFKSYTRKHKWVFFLKIVYIVSRVCHSRLSGPFPRLLQILRTRYSENE